MQNKIKPVNMIPTILLCLAANTVSAHNVFFDSPYVGVEAIQTNLNYKQGYGKGVYHTSPQDYNVFVGFKVNRCMGLGIEGGYEYQPARSKNVTLSDGDYPPGMAVITSPNSEHMNSKIKGEHPYLGVFLEADQRMLPSNKLKLQFLVGASYSHINARDTVTSINGTPANVVNNYSQYKFIPMAKIMIGHNITDNLGARLSLNYHNFTRFKINSMDGNGQIKLRDTLGVGLGLTYSLI